MRLVIAVLVAAICVPVAVASAALGIDVLRAPGELTTADRLFHTDPTREPEWDVGFVPADASERLLGLEDDLRFRELAAVYVDVEPGAAEVDDSARADALAELDRLSGEEGDPARRSRALTMYGVLALAGLPEAGAERDESLRAAGSAFRRAIDLDPSNTDAMTNLQALLDRYGEVEVEAS